MQVSGQSLNQRASSPYPNPGPGFYSGFTEDKNINGPWLARAAVRESKLHGVDWIKIYTTQDFVGGRELYEFKPDGSLVASPSLTLEEVQAIVDEAHRMGLKVACHTYGGDGMRSCINAGVDLSMHVTELYKDDALLNTVVQKKLPIMMTIDDLVGLDAGDKRLLANLGLTGDKAVTRLGMAELTFKKLLKAGVPLAVRQRRGRRRRRVSAREAGRPVRLDGQVGHDAGAGAPDGLHDRSQRAQLQLGEPRRQPREGQVRRRHRRGGQSAHRRHRDGARQVRDEGRRGHEERPGLTPAVDVRPG